MPLSRVWVWVALAVSSTGMRGAPPSTRAAKEPKATVAYANDFEKAAGGEWSHRDIGVTPKGRRRYLGPFGNHEVRLTLKDLPAHTNLRVSFDLFVLRSWDGKEWSSPGAGPDVWSAEVAGRGKLLRCTFANQPMQFSNQQTFPDPYPGPLHPPQTGAAERDSLGQAAGGEELGSAVYRLSFAFPHRAGDLTLRFASAHLEPLDNESWGLDNVRVELAPSPPPPDEKHLRACWEALHGEQRVRAFRAYCDLLAAGEHAAVFLERTLRPRPVDEAAARREIAALDARQWARREKASEALRRMGPHVAPLLREALDAKPSAEAATRIGDLLEGFTSGELDPTDLACSLRVLRVLRMAGSPKAVEALGHLRRHSPDERVRCLAGAAAANLGEPIVEACLRRADAKAGLLDFAAAKAACREALEIAEAAGAISEGRVAAKLARLDRLASALGRLNQLAARLKTARDNRDLRDRLIRTALVELDSPSAAAAYLDDRCDETLRRRVGLAARDPAGLAHEELLATAKWYRQLAAGAGQRDKAAMLRRARNYLSLRERRLRKTADETAAVVEGIDGELARQTSTEWTDILPHVHTRVHRVSGEWTADGKALRVAPAEFARLAVPVVPRGDYELVADFVRKTGAGDVNFILPVGSTGVLFTLDDNHGQSGFQLVDGKDLPKPDGPHDLANDRAHRFEATVRRRGDQASIRIRLDGKDYMRWQGPVRSLSVRGSWAVSEKGTFGLGAHQSTVEFSRLRLRMLSGRAELAAFPIDPPRRRQTMPDGGVIHLFGGARPVHVEIN